MQERISAAEYREMLKKEAGNKKASSNLTALTTGERISSAAYRKSLAASGGLPVDIATTPAVMRPPPPPKAASHKKPSASPAVDSPAKPRKYSDRIFRVIESIEQAALEGVVVPGERVSFTWKGMSILSLNEMLREDHRASGMHNYRKSCHQLVFDSAILLSGAQRIVQFDGPVRLHIRRSGQKLIDTDGLYAAFKFLIDGFRAAGFIRDDDPNTITGMTHEQSVGEPCVGIDVYRVDPGPVCTIIETPYAGDVEKNLRYTAACMLDSIRRGEAPLSSQMLYAANGVLDDTKAEERRMGTNAGFAWFSGAKKHVAYIDNGISSGMREGIDRAAREGLTTEFRALPDWAS